MGNRKVLLAILIVLLVLGGAAAWFFTRPTLESTFAAAEAADKAAHAKAAVSKPEDVKPDYLKVIELYRRVAVFGKNDKHAESLFRIGKIQQDDLHDDDAAIKAFDELVPAYPAEEARAGEATLRQAAILRKQGQDLLATNKADAAKKFHDALAKLEAYRKAFTTGKRFDETLLTTGNIKQSDLKSAPSESIEPFRQLVKDFPDSQYKPEALYHIGELLEQMGRSEEALAIFGELNEQFPTDEWGRKAGVRQAKMLADKATTAEQAEAAAERARKIAEKNPGTPEGDEAGEIAREAAGSAAGRAAGSSARSRYGAIPTDTGFGAPPWEEMKQFYEQKLDAKTYTMTVDFLPSDHRMTVAGTLEVVNAGDDKDRQILFMLGKGFDLSKITLDGVPVTAKHEDDMLQVPVDKTIKTGQTFILGFEYTARFAGPIVPAAATAPATGPGTTTGPSTRPGDEGPMDNPRKLKEAMEEAAKGAKGSGPAVNLQCALGNDGFALSGAGWYPITYIGDIFEAKVTYHVPPDLTVAATGAEETSPRHGGKPGEFTFATHRPVFGIYFAYGDYVVNEQTVGTVKYVTYLKTPNASKSSAYVETASRILNFYGEKFMPFPYEKMAIVETPLPPILGGVGPSSMMMLSSTMVAHKDPPEWLLAHELAHQWFGNLVPINIADPGYSQWLSEGFATYCDALYTEHREGRPALIEQVKRYARTYFQVAGYFRAKPPSVRSCLQSSAMYRPVVYEKGALVLHSLRKVIGDEKFFALMRAYVEKNQDRASVVGDFEKLAAEINGQPLDWFFKEWLDEPTYALWTIQDVSAVSAETVATATAPSTTATTTTAPAATAPAATAGGEGGGVAKPFKVTVKIEQPRYVVRMPVDITLVDSAGGKSVVTIEIKDKQQTLELPSDFKPVKVIIDEDCWTLHSLSAANIWPKEAATAPAAATTPSKTPATRAGPAVRVETLPSPK